MKKIAMIFIMFFCFSSFSKTLVIDAKYNSFDNRLIKKEWTVKTFPDRIEFYLKNQLKAKMFIQNGKITKISEIKFIAGKKKEFEVKEENKIKLELQSGFYPFAFVYNYLYGKTTIKKNFADSSFQLKEVKEK